LPALIVKARFTNFNPSAKLVLGVWNPCGVATLNSSIINIATLLILSPVNLLVEVLPVAVG